eukprot:2365905-Prymnesium_polylepis.1
MLTRRASSASCRQRPKSCLPASARPRHAMMGRAVRAHRRAAAGRQGAARRRRGSTFRGSRRSKQRLARRAAKEAGRASGDDGMTLFLCAAALHAQHADDAVPALRLPGSSLGMGLTQRRRAERALFWCM